MTNSCPGRFETCPYNFWGVLSNALTKKSVLVGRGVHPPAKFVGGFFAPDLPFKEHRGEESVF